MSKKDRKEGERAIFATRFGVIATTVGSAVGLGNIWRFPYEAGTQGGGAYMLIYVLFILILGIPVICAEFILGREGRNNIFGTFRKLKQSSWWHYTGYIGILASLMILCFYSVVAGWTLEYFFQAITGGIGAGVDYSDKFSGFCTGWRPVLWTVIFLAINFFVCRRGVQKGLEKISNILMPLLFAILLGFCFFSLTLPKAGEGMEFLFKPDFSHVTGTTVLSALGQAFFSLSLGLGCMLTYASYFKNGTNIVRAASTTAFLDTLVAIMSGVIIFPAVFSFGFSPAAGPTLVFEVFPQIFGHMTGGAILAAFFFLMLFLASLTSTISMSEISVTFFSEEWHMRRGGATILTNGIALAGGVLCALSFGAMSGLNLFNIFDFVSSNILLPVGGLLISIFAGWIVDRKVLQRQLTNDGKIRNPLMRPVVFCLRYVAPPCLFLILLMGLDIF